MARALFVYAPGVTLAPERLDYACIGPWRVLLVHTWRVAGGRVVHAYLLRR